MRKTHDEWVSLYSQVLGENVRETYFFTALKYRFLANLARGSKDSILQHHAEMLARVSVEGWKLLLDEEAADAILLEQEEKEEKENEPVECVFCHNDFPRKEIRYANRKHTRSSNRFPTCQSCFNIYSSNQRTCRWCSKTFIVSDNFEPWVHCGICRLEYDSETELQRLDRNIRRAITVREPATLSWPEWEAIVKSFDGCCAYCQQVSFDVLEHFIPIGGGVGTVKQNCVPACNDCNNKKRDGNLSKDLIERVRACLALL